MVESSKETREERVPRSVSTAREEVILNKIGRLWLGARPKLLDIAFSLTVVRTAKAAKLFMMTTRVGVSRVFPAPRCDYGGLLRTCTASVEREEAGKKAVCFVTG